MNGVHRRSVGDRSTVVSNDRTTSRRPTGGEEKEEGGGWGIPVRIDASRARIDRSGRTVDVDSIVTLWARLLARETRDARRETLTRRPERTRTTSEEIER